MSDGLQIDFIGLDAFTEQMQQGPEIVREEMIAGVDRLTRAGRAIAMKAAPFDTGHLRRSITQEKASFAGGQVSGAFGTNVPYAAAMESGRGAGKAMPPPGALVGWMRRHGIALSEFHESTPGLTADDRFGTSPYHQIEFAIARAIGKRGIPGHFYMKKAKDELTPKVQAEFKAVADRIVKRMGGG